MFSVTAYNAATGVAVTAGFNSPRGLNQRYGLAVNSTTLFVANYGNSTLGAFNLATGVAVPGFTTVTGLNGPVGVALYGNDLFVANVISNTVGKYNATTGAVINASFIGCQGSRASATEKCEVLSDFQISLLFK